MADGIITKTVKFWHKDINLDGSPSYIVNKRYILYMLLANRQYADYATTGRTVTAFPTITGYTGKEIGPGFNPFPTDPWGDKRHQFSRSQLQDSLYFVVKIKTYMVSRFKEHYTHPNTQK